MPLFWFSLAIIIGIASASFLNIPLPIMWVALLASILSGWFEIRSNTEQKHVLLSKPVFRIPISFLITGFLLGISQFQNTLPPVKPDHIYFFSGKESAEVVGVVSSDPHRTSRITDVTISCNQITHDGKSYPIGGKMAVSLPRGYRIEYGDMVRVQGDIKSTVPGYSTPIESFEGREKIFAEMSFPDLEIIAHGKGTPLLASLYRYRERANEVLFDLLPFPESAVLSGILLGIDTFIPPHLWNAYRASGTAHIIVISGFNISIIASLVYKLFRKTMRRNIVLPATIAVVLFYTLLVGADKPVVRAAIMAIIALPAHQIGRRAIGLHSLAIAAAIMLIVNPFLLWDISFQLSFLATLALLVMADPIKNWIAKTFAKRREENDENSFMPLVDTFSATIAASFVVFPILFRLSGTISSVSLLANILIAPIQPLIMTLGGISVLLGYVSPKIGSFPAFIVWPLVAFCDQIALRLSAHPAATIPLPAWIYWVSLAASTLSLGYFSIKQIAGFSSPEPDSDP